MSYQIFKEKEELFLKKAQEVDWIKSELQRLRLRMDRNFRNTKKIVAELVEQEKTKLFTLQSEIAKKQRESEEELVRRQNEFEEEQRAFYDQKEQDIEVIQQLFEEKSTGFPWLAKAYSDYSHLKEMKEADFLETKKHPAMKAADVVRDISRAKREIEKKFRIVKYLLEYHENLFPWLVDFRGQDLDELIKQVIEKDSKEKEFDEEYDDPAKKWLTKAEYANLSTVEKFQLALDRYWKKRKTPWEIGRDYERYIGYLYEKSGYDVYYQGIVEGLADLGRDIIAIKGDTAEVVQCKYWSKNKIIHEKWICQFKGTVLKYCLESPSKKVVGCFVTSTKLSDVAREFAKALDIYFEEEKDLEPYPSIKCNVSRGTGEKIYHLPFDQQYDRTLVEEERNECYIETVAEAESLGFRRAFRWRGQEAKRET